MGKTKVILDTNILISALGWEGPPHHVFGMVVDGEIELVISDGQFGELSRVLEYPKFNFTDEQKDRFKSLILEAATFVRSVEKVGVIKNDPDDNMILEAAVAGNVDYIVSGDPDLLRLKKFRNIRIVTAKEFFDDQKTKH